MDVSASIDMDDHCLQVKGLADALRDPAIIDARVAVQDSPTVVQRSGARFRQLTLPWQQFTSA